MIENFYKLEKVKVRDGQELSVAILGSSSTKYKKHVVLVHGIGGNHHTWLPFCLPFLLDYTFIIPNLRGFGESKNADFSKPHDAVRQFAEDLDDIINTLVPSQDEKVILAGLSMGAYSCLCYLDMTKCRRVEKYLNVDQSPKAFNCGEHGMLGRRAKYILPRMTTIMQEFENYLEYEFDDLPEVLQHEFLDALGDFLETAFHRPYERFIAKNICKFKFKPVIDMVSADRFQSYYYCLKSYVERDYDFRDVVKKYDLPVYVHVGLNSEMYPPLGQYSIVDNAKNLVQVVEFDEAHALMYTSPVKFYRAFKEFLRR